MVKMLEMRISKAAKLLKIKESTAKMMLKKGLDENFDWRRSYQEITKSYSQYLNEGRKKEL
jgi:glycogen synthase